MKRAAAVLTALALSGSLAACGDDGTEDLAPSASTSTPRSSPVPTVSPTVSPTEVFEPSGPPTATAAAGEDDDAPAGFPVEPALSEQEPSGGPLTVTAVRVARQEGYDRVVFELAGKAGQAGWRVEYVDEPRAQGSGEPVPVDGEAALSVLITGTGYPMDTGQEEVADDPALPGGLEVVADVVLGGVFEGQYEAFIGTSGRQPFRVFRLADPERVVVDVRSS
jgi:predicted small lipoprotein YifL